MTTTLLLDGELVLTCVDCGCSSTDDVFGTEGWTLRRVSAQCLVDVCPACSPRARAKVLPRRQPAGYESNGRGSEHSAASPAGRVGLATSGPASQLSPMAEALPEKCPECRAVHVPVEVRTGSGRAQRISFTCPDCYAQLGPAVPIALLLPPK